MGRALQTAVLVVALLVAYDLGASRTATGVGRAPGGSTTPSGPAERPPVSTTARTARPTPGSTVASTPGSTSGPTARTTPEPTIQPTIQPAFGTAPFGPTEQARVVRVVDGDTIVVDRGHGTEKLRYIGMDTPETVDPNRPVEPMGAEASKANAALVAGRTVWLEKDVSEVDRFGRLLRDVWLPDAGQPSGWLFVNLELVARGYAQVATFPPDVRYVDLLLAAQQRARQAGVGLWSGAAVGSTLTAPPTTPSTVGPGGSDCHPSYTPCLPIVDDLDCPEVRAMGKAPVTVIGPDDYRLDRDGDGTGCD
jgi:micrococcal nuclease